MALPAIVTTFLPFLDKVLDMIPNPQAREKARQDLTMQLVNIAADENKAQTEVNKAEAQHPNVFVAGWRPFIGWTCGVSLAWTYTICPVLSWFSVVLFDYTGTFPELDTAPMLTLVTSMLGVGIMRSFDKFNGTDTKIIQPKQ